MKRCLCCDREYTAETFALLKLRGWVGTCWCNGKAMALELRDCKCGSTIGMECEAPKNIRRANASVQTSASAGGAA